MTQLLPPHGHLGNFAKSSLQNAGAPTKCKSMKVPGIGKGYKNRREDVHSEKSNPTGSLSQKRLGPVNKLVLKRAEQKNELVATWLPPSHTTATDVFYSVSTYCDGSNTGVLTKTTDCQYVVPSADPTKKYKVEVAASFQNVIPLNWKKSNEIMIYNDLGPVYMDNRMRLRPGYRVYEGALKKEDPSNSTKVAVKLMVMFDQTDFNHDKKQLLALKHQNIASYLKLETFGPIGDEVCIAMELCRRDTLFEIVRNGELLPENKKIVVSQIAHGLNYLHSRDCFHKNLKPHNVLRSLDGKDMKISDFGISKEVMPDASEFLDGAREFGTDGWKAPEQYEKNKVGKKVDVFSCGLVMFYVLSDGKHPFGDVEYEWKTRIIANRREDQITLKCENSEDAKDSILKMIARNLRDRPTLKGVLSHQFFKSIPIGRHLVC